MLDYTSNLICHDEVKAALVIHLLQVGYLWEMENETHA